MGSVIKAGHVLEAEYEESEEHFKGLGLSGVELEAAVAKDITDLMAHDRVRPLSPRQIRRKQVTIDRLKRVLRTG